MSVIYIPGVWDLLHVGHVHILEKAAKYGELIVGVPSDTVVHLDKGQYPVINEFDRLRMLNALSCVTTALLYRKLEFITHLDQIMPSDFAIGGTWGNEGRHKDAEAWCKQYNVSIRKFEYYEGDSTTSIKERIHESVCSRNR